MATPPTPENLVLQAVMDEFEENREKGNLTAEILNKEKVKSYISYVYQDIMCILMTLSTF